MRGAQPSKGHVTAFLGESRQFDFERRLASGLSKQGNPEQIMKEPNLTEPPPPLLYFWHLLVSSVVCPQAYNTFI